MSLRRLVLQQVEVGRLRVGVSAEGGVVKMSAPPNNLSSATHLRPPIFGDPGPSDAVGGIQRNACHRSRGIRATHGIEATHSIEAKRRYSNTSEIFCVLLKKFPTPFWVFFPATGLGQSLTFWMHSLSTNAVFS